MMASAAQAATPQQWVKSFWPTAKAAGISWATYEAALGNFTPDPEVLKKASSQAEFNQKIWLYLHGAVSERRIVTGQYLLGQYGPLLTKIEQRYGVDLASTSGPGDFETIASLAAAVRRSRGGD